MMIVFILGWVACGVLSYGVLLAYHWNEFPTLRRGRDWRQTRRLALMASFLGPFALLAALLATGGAVDGIMFKRPEEHEQN